MRNGSDSCGESVLISLPFKLMLFVLVDGWSLIMGTLAASFYT